MNGSVGQRLWKMAIGSGSAHHRLGSHHAGVTGADDPRRLPSIRHLPAAERPGRTVHVAFTLPRSAAGRVLPLISGALSAVLAILSFRHLGDAYAVLLLSLWIAISFIFQGISGVAAGSARATCLAAAGTSLPASSPCSPDSWCWHGHLSPSSYSPSPPASGS
jgi:hypothetical protein